MPSPLSDTGPAISTCCLLLLVLFLLLLLLEEVREDFPEEVMLGEGT